DFTPARLTGRNPGLQREGRTECPESGLRKAAPSPAPFRGLSVAAENPHKVVFLSRIKFEMRNPAHSLKQSLPINRLPVEFFLNPLICQDDINIFLIVVARTAQK